MTWRPGNMKENPYGSWEAIIGLEIHVQLNTKSKLFSSAANHFGDEPNVNITDVCTGQPGTLPVLNKDAVTKAIKLGCALGSDISLWSRFDRKSYFYPDSPRNFQITQMDEPILKGGSLNALVEGQPKSFAIHRAHLEDDAGMLKHFTNFAGVDYNRAGCGLIEIVSEPCMRTPKEASAYASAMRTLLLYLDICDGNMEEGSLRVDCNVSVRKQGEKELRSKIEIKNLNSFNYMELALESEIQRQIRLYTENETQDPKTLLRSGTYRFDVEKKQTVLMRFKEKADDYRYFPEPDLPPIVLTSNDVETVRKTLPELPLARLSRYSEVLGLPKDRAEFLMDNKPLADFFEEALKTANFPKPLANWILVEFTGRLKDSGKTILDTKISPEHIAKLVSMIEEGKITGKIAKSVADDMVIHPGKDPEEIVKENPDYSPLTDPSAIEPLVLKVLEENPDSIAAFKSGKIKAFAFLVGQVMKLCNGKASSDVVNELLKKHLN